MPFTRQKSSGGLLGAISMNLRAYEGELGEAVKVFLL
jgi:hypothetical protein